MPHRIGWVDVRADDLNGRFKELVGDDYTVKDLRTWHGTVLAAAAFVDADPAVSQRVVKRVEAAVMKEVAEELGNTPAVARGSYVDPRVVTGYEQGLTIAAAARRADRARRPDAAQEILEKATRMLIRRVAKRDSASPVRGAKRLTQVFAALGLTAVRRGILANSVLSSQEVDHHAELVDQEREDVSGPAQAGQLQGKVGADFQRGRGAG